MQLCTPRYVYTQSVNILHRVFVHFPIHLSFPGSSANCKPLDCKPLSRVYTSWPIYPSFFPLLNSTKLTRDSLIRSWNTHTHTHTYTWLLRKINFFSLEDFYEKVRRSYSAKKRRGRGRLNEINEYSWGGYISTQEDISAVDPRYVFMNDSRMGIGTKSFVIVDVMESSRELIDLEPLIIFHSTVLDFPSIYQRGD